MQPLNSDSAGRKAAYIKERTQLLIVEAGIVSSLVFSFLVCYIEPKQFVAMYLDLRTGQQAFLKDSMTYASYLKK